MHWIKVVAINIFVFLVLAALFDLGMHVFIAEKPKNLHNYDSPYVPRPYSRNGNYDLNEDGTKTASVECSASSKARKVLFIGDSNIEANFASEENQLPGQILSDLLNTGQSGTCFQVDSYGGNGYGPDQTYFALKGIVGEKDYDILIYLVFADNDVGDLLRSRYPSDGNGLVNEGYCYAVGSPLSRSKVFRIFRDAVYQLSGYWIDVSQPVSSVPEFQNCVNPSAFGIDKDALSKLAAVQVRAEADRKAFRAGMRQNYLGDRYDIEIACGVDDEITRWQFQQLIRVFNQLADLAHARNMQTILLLLPSEWDMTFNHVANPASLKQHCSGYSPTRLSDFIIRAYRDSGLDGDLVSLVADFDGCNECYFSEAEMRGDNHWNYIGIRRAMEKVIQADAFTFGIEQESAQISPKPSGGPE